MCCYWLGGADGLHLGGYVFPSFSPVLISILLPVALLSKQMGDKYSVFRVLGSASIHEEINQESFATLNTYYNAYKSWRAVNPIFGGAGGGDDGGGESSGTTIGWGGARGWKGWGGGWWCATVGCEIVGIHALDSMPIHYDIPPHILFSPFSLSLSLSNQAVAMARTGRVSHSSMTC